MRKKLNTIILLFLVLSSELVFGEKSSKTKTRKANKSTGPSKIKSEIERIKRSLDEEPFWGNRGKKQTDDTPNYSNRNDELNKGPKLLKERDIEDEPFWGTRGRRDSLSSENYADEEYPEYVPYDHSNCKDCFGTVHRFSARDKSLRNLDDDVEPFWGNRGRRASNEIKESNPFWGNRGKRQDNEPFWGARGRRDDEPFWGNRGRRDDEPFWSNRGRRDDEPFWGNRGRRQDEEPFWGNRGRRNDEPFWGNRGRRREESWEADSKKELKQSILSAMNDVENDIERLSRLKKDQTSFWSTRGRDSKLQAMFNEVRSKSASHHIPNQYDMNLRNTDPGTLTDSRMYADQPNFILVERSSRSSGEEDPFFITRGKKYNLNYNLFKTARDRRGAIEDIVKSVRNDPYYIARGKKDIANTASSNGELEKVKELICSTVDLISPKNKGKVKKEFDTERERRTILKKLAAQLQNDPYFVSRGKKSGNANNEEYFREFIKEIAEKCY